MRRDTVVIPHDEEMERILLGEILVRESAMGAVSSILSPEDFYDPLHNAIFASCCELEAEGIPIEPGTVFRRLRGHSVAQQISASYLIGLTEVRAMASAVQFYATEIRKLSLQRNAIHAANRLVRNPNALQICLEEVTAIHKSMREIEMPEKDRYRKNNLFMSDVMEYIQDAASNQHRTISSTIREWDAATGGLFPSDLVVLAARPSVGKTWMGLQQVMATAKAGLPAMFFSLEMSWQQLGVRVTAARSAVPFDKLRVGDLDEAMCDRVMLAGKTISEYPGHFVVDDTSREIGQIVESAREFHKINGGATGLIVVDYLQLVRTATKEQNREQEVAIVSSALKQLAKELDCAVVALCQFNRAAETSAKPRPPVLSDLRESGAIEQDADQVIGMWQGETHDVVHLKMLKNRHGVVFDTAVTRTLGGFKQ